MRLFQLMTNVQELIKLIVCASPNAVAKRQIFLIQQISTLQVYITTSCITCRKETISCKQTNAFAVVLQRHFKQVS